MAKIKQIHRKIVFIDNHIGLQSARLETHWQLQNLQKEKKKVFTVASQNDGYIGRFSENIMSHFPPLPITI